MELEIRIRAIDSAPRIERLARQKVHTHLHRFASQLNRVTVRLQDENGPKGGLDKRCHIVATGPRVGTLTVDTLMENPLAAVDRCVTRMTEVVRRTTSKTRTRDTRAVSIRDAF